MVDVPDKYSEKVEEFAESKEVDVEKAEGIYEDALAEVEDYAGDSMEDSKIAKIAFSTFRSDVLDLVSGGGSVVNFVSIGHTGVQMWPLRDTDGDYVDASGEKVNSKDEAARKEVLVAQGLVDAPHDDMDVGLCSFIMDSTDGIDIDHAMNLLQPLTGVKGKFQVDDIDSLRNHYIAWSSNGTSLEEAYEDFPEDKDTLRAVLVENTEQAEIANITDGLSATEMVNGSRRTTGFGVDIKRIKGNISDYYISDDGDTATYTVIDESVEPGDIKDDERIVGENQRTPGLTLWSSEDKMEYGKGTEAEFYGAISQSDESGQISMDLAGIVPIFPRPLERGGQGDDYDDGNKETSSF